MKTPLISNKFKKEEAQLNKILNEYLDLVYKNPILDSDKIAEIKKEFETPFNFVAIGKVKSGKSSFLNALLGVKKGEEEIFKSGAAVETSKITIARKGNKEPEIENNVVIIYKDIESLEGIEIIDTPGTDSIMEKHEKITYDFLENCNLVMFVFEAKNIYTKSDWELIKKIVHQFKKDIIFILQQKDRAKEEEIQTSKKELIAKCNEIGIKDPKIFVTSAALEMESQEGSGFEEVREYIFKEIGSHEKKSMKLKTIINKLRDSITNNESILEKEINTIEDYRKYYETLSMFLEDNYMFLKENIEITIRDSIISYYSMKMKTLKDKVISLYKTQSKVKDLVEAELIQFRKDTNDMFKDIVNRNLNDILKEQNKRIEKMFSKEEIAQKVKDEPYLKMQLQTDIERYFEDFERLIQRELHKVLDDAFKSIKFKNKTLFNRIYLTRSITKSIEEEILLQEEKIKNLLNVLIDNFLKDMNTKTKTKMLESHEDIQNKIDNLEKYQELKRTLDSYMKQLENIEQAIKL